MKQFSASIAIKAPVGAIWVLLTDAAGYPAWNSTVTKIDGTIAPGKTVTVHAKAAGRAFPVKVTEFEPPSRMAWTGGMPLGLFVGTRTFTLAPRPDGNLFTMEESFTGLLSGLIGRSIPDLQPAFEAFAADLKRAAERTVQPTS
jgi:hypothetical protein